MKTLVLEVYKLISTAAWSNQITTPIYPSDFKLEPTEVPFIKITILPVKSTNKSYGSIKSVSGIIVLSIFYEAGIGQTFAADLADKIDSVFQNTIIDNDLVQLGKSVLQYKGVDPDDKTIARADYSVPFEYFGEN